MKKMLVLGAGGFIGSHLVIRLKKQGHYVTGVDLHLPEFSVTAADNFIVGDLRDRDVCRMLLEEPVDEIYQLAADMGGAGYVFTGINDMDILYNSALINLNIINELMKNPKPKIFFSSSACIYPAYNQLDPDNPNCEESSAYPAEPDSEYGWEKLFSERLYQNLKKNYGVEVHIGRYHNIFGVETSWNNGKEKAPAAICRKVAQAHDGGSIDVWGDGSQTRSFLYIDECLDATIKIMASDFAGQANIGSEESVSITELAKKVIAISGKNISINYVDGPIGVNGRNSDNRLIKEKLGWTHTQSLDDGLKKLYDWIVQQNNAVN